VTGVNLKAAGQLERIGTSDSLDLARDSVAICIPVCGAHDLFVQCLRSVIRHTPAHMPILIADDATDDPKTERFLEHLAASGVLKQRLVLLKQPTNLGFVQNVNSAFHALAPADVVILNSDCIVGPEWVERLRDAACSDSTIATATALTNHGTMLSVPERNMPRAELPDHLDVEQIAGLVATQSPQLRPRIPTAIGHCMYLRRKALDLVGGFDPAFSPGYGEEVDFSQRCLAHGLVHVAADDVFVFHRGQGSFNGADDVQSEHENLVRTRHPFYHDAVRTSSARLAGPLSRSLAIAAISVRPLSVTIDGRFLGQAVTGTQVQALELIHALWRTRRADLRVVIPRRVGEWARAALEGLDGLELVQEEAAAEGRQKPTDILHRPSQLFTWPELRLVTGLGRRFVITQLDLISYRNPTYHRSFTDWREYQRLTRLSLALADQVVFMSDHARSDALAEELVSPSRARVVRLGVDHHVPTQVEARRPRMLPEAAQKQFLLYIGTNFRHKNRLFALRLLDALQERHGWDGWLVFAGPHARHGTSAGDEAEFLATRPRLAARVVDLRAVNENEKLWLFRNAGGVVYPSTYEGFGLVPFEAAESGTPCFFAWQTSLQDVLPESAATLVPWAAEPSADEVVAALSSGDRKRELIEAVSTAAAELTWHRAAEAMLETYAHAVAAPNRALASLADEGVPTTLERLTSIRNPEVLDIEPQLYRALYALTTSPTVAGPFVRGVKALYTAGYLVKHGRRPSAFMGEG
jgi:GT2 family glycosyltransferase